MPVFSGFLAVTVTETRECWCRVFLDPEPMSPRTESPAARFVLRGNTVTLGYYKDPDGYVERPGRMKDVIISGGGNITSIEIENSLTEHPDVAEVAVAVAPQQKWGEPRLRL